MFTMIAVSFSLFLQPAFLIPPSDDTCVAYPWETVTPIPLSQGGVYKIWIAVDRETGGTVTVSGKQFSVGPVKQEKKKGDTAWGCAGEVALETGPVSTECGPGAFLVALSKAPGFNPETALSDVRALPLPHGAGDRRADNVRHTDTVFTMPRYDTVAAWEKKAALLRKRLLLGSGLFPMPEKTPLNEKIFDETVGDGFAVSKVCFEPWPGFLATGNLYRPLGEGPFPAVVNPHGHWEKGRLEDSDKCSVPGRCITLARMGMVALSYDMIGYVDSKQTSHNWGGESEKLWGIHTFALQLWTSLRAVDLVAALPYVDGERIGCTGASGGGTQTFSLTAIEPRIRVAAPVNMISSTMQGGCLCENAPLLRLDNSNMEIGALAAPRPLLMISATGDWTRETPRVEYPAIRGIYALYHGEDKIANVHLDYGHNYNRESREAMYRFFGEHLLGGDWQNFQEPSFVKPSDEALRVFPDDKPPEGYLSGRDLSRHLVAQAEERRAARLALAAKDEPAFRAQYEGVFAAMLGTEIPDINRLNPERFGMEEREGYVLERWVIGRADAGDRIPALFYRGRDAHPQDAVILVHGRGKAALADLENGGPGGLIRELIGKGKAVLALDAFLTGEHHEPGAERKRAKVGAFADTFQPTDTACRVQDVMTAAAFLRSRYDTTGVIDVVGLEEGGLWCLFAGAADPGVRRILVDLNQADITSDALWESRYYVPGIRCLGDIPAACIAGGRGRFFLFNGGSTPDLEALNLPVAPGLSSSAEIIDILAS